MWSSYNTTDTATITVLGGKEIVVIRKKPVAMSLSVDNFLNFPNNLVQIHFTEVAEIVPQYAANDITKIYFCYQMDSSGWY